MQSFLPKCSYRRTKDVFTTHTVSVYTLTNMTNSNVTPIAPFVHGAQTSRQLKCCCELLLWVTRGRVTFAERPHECHLNIAVHVAKCKVFIIMDVAPQIQQRMRWARRLQSALDAMQDFMDQVLSFALPPAFLLMSNLGS